MNSSISKTILGYLHKKRRGRLFEQWVEQAGLPAEEVPSNLQKEQPPEEDWDSNTKTIGHITSIGIDRGIVRLPFRYVLIGISVIVLLLVALSVVCTILIIQS